MLFKVQVFQGSGPRSGFGFRSSLYQQCNVHKTICLVTLKYRDIIAIVTPYNRNNIIITVSVQSAIIVTVCRCFDKTELIVLCVLHCYHKKNIEK